MKKTFLKIAGAVLLLSFGVQNKEAEDFMREMRQCTQQLKAEKNTDLEISYRVYHSHTSEVVAESAKGKFCKRGDQTYYSLMGTTFIQNREMLLVIDDSTKSVLVQKTGKFFHPVEEQVDLKRLNAYTRNVTVKKEKDKVYYRVEVKDAEVKTLGVSIDLKKHQVEKMELFYAHQSEIIEKTGAKVKVLPRMEISYRKAAQKTPESIFDTGRIIRKVKKGFVLAPAYKKYQLTDQFHNKTK